MDEFKISSEYMKRIINHLKINSPEYKFTSNSKYDTGILKSTNTKHKDTTKSKYNTEFKNIRNDILKRDDYKCVECGADKKTTYSSYNRTHEQWE